jgi:outer membrane protein TolC
MSRKELFLLLICLVGLPAFAQNLAQASPQASQLPVLTLQNVLDAASAAGDDFTLAAKTLDLARKQRSLDLAKQGLAVSASGAYFLADGVGTDGGSSSSIISYDQGLIGKAVSAAAGSSPSSYQGISQVSQGGLALSGPLTKVNLSVSHSIPVPKPTDTSSAFASPPSSVVGLTLTQTVWDGYQGGQYQAALSKSLLTLKGKELAAAQSNSTAITKVKQAYIAMLAAQRDFAVKTQVLGKQQALLSQIQATYAMKQATAIDLKTAQVNARSADIDLRTARKTLDLANERLDVMMGRGAGDRFTVADLEDSPMPAASVDEAIRIGLQRRADVAQLDLNSRSALIDAQVTRAQSVPALSLTGGAGLAVGWLTPAVTAGAISVGAKLGLPVYDSGAADLQAKTSEGQAALYGLQAAQLRKSLSSDIRDYFESARLLAEKVSLAKDSRDLAEAQFELVKAQNNFGTATVQDVLTASVTASTADVNYEAARSAYLSAVLQLSSAMGL